MTDTVIRGGKLATDTHRHARTIIYPQIAQISQITKISPEGGHGERFGDALPCTNKKPTDWISEGFFCWWPGPEWNPALRNLAGGSTGNRSHSLTVIFHFFAHQYPSAIYAAPRRDALSFRITRTAMFFMNASKRPFAVKAAMK